MSNKYIGVFDSGLGGVAVVRYLKKYLPKENIIFLADYKNCPYGSKTRKQLLDIVSKNISFINQYDLKTVSIACNTADSLAGEMIDEFFDIPVCHIIEPTCKEALKVSKNKKIGVIATKACINGGKYQETFKNLDPDAKIYPLATPALVTLVESKKYTMECEDTVETLKDYFSHFENTGIDTMVLGCTHYDLLLDICENIMPDINFVSSSKCVADYTLDMLEDKNEEEGKREFCVTAFKEKFDRLSSYILEEDIDSKLI
ncbi:MAG: glutamate racemase [Erysipelotrichaceae bacterium]|nr:glutamate racemase [Erysipelotrichaceae bacterium]